MGSGKNEGNPFSGGNLIGNLINPVLNQGKFVLGAVKRNNQAPNIPEPPPPTVGTPPATPTDFDPSGSLAVKQRKLAALRYGFASTITSNPALAPAGAQAPLKSKLGM